MPRRLWRSLDVPSPTARPGAGNALTRQTVDIRETTSPTAELDRKSILLSGYYSALGASFGVTGVPGRSWTVDRAVREGYARVVWVYKAVETIAGNQARLKVVAHDGSYLIPDHPAPLLLNGDKCSQLGESGKIYRKRLSMQVLLSPRGAFTEVIKSRANTPLSYTLLPPNRTRVVPASDGTIDHYEVDPLRPGDKIRKIDPENVRWTREPHPTDPYAGMTPLEAAGLSIEMDHFARLFNRSFMANDGRPGMVIGIKPTDEDSGEMDPREAERIERKFGQGPLEAGRTVVVDGTVSAVDVGGTPRDGSWLNIRDAGKDEILVAFGVPESEIGNASGQTFANAGHAKESYWVITQLPHNDTVDDTWGPDRLDASIDITFDVSKVDALSRFDKDRRAEMRIEVADGFRTIKSYMEHAGAGWYEPDEVLDMPATRSLWIVGGIPAALDAHDQEAVDKLTPLGTGAGAAATRGGAPGGTPGGFAPTRASAAGVAGGVTPAGGAGMVPTANALPAITGAKSGMPRERKLRAVGGRVIDASDDEEDHRERDIAAQTLAALLTAIANRLTEVTIAKVAGRQGRAGTRHWAPKAGQPASTKALNYDAVVDPQQWHDQVLSAAMQVLGPAGVTVGNNLRQQLADAGLVPPDTDTAPPSQQPPPQMIPPPYGGDGDAHPILDYAIIRAAMWLAKAGASKAQELRDKIEAAERADIERVRKQGPVDVTPGGPDSVAPIIAAIREWQAGPDGDTGLAAWARTRAESAATGTTEGVRHGLLAGLADSGQVKVTQSWHTRQDDRVREAHRIAEGQEVAAGEPFIVGGEPLRYPGDPAGSPGTVINCRCHTRTKIELAPESKDLVRTAAGAERFGVPIGSMIEARRHATSQHRSGLPGNVDAVAWGHEREDALAAAAPFMLGGLGKRDDQGRAVKRQAARRKDAPKPPTEMVPSYVPDETESIEAKRAVAADLAGRMTDVPDAALLAAGYAGSTDRIEQINAAKLGEAYAKDALDPDLLWVRDTLSGRWERHTPVDDEHDAKLLAAVKANDGDAINDVGTAPGWGDISAYGYGKDPYTGEPTIAVGGPEMQRRLREQAVATLVHKWAETSNDHSAWSLAQQQIVGEAFGLTDAHEWTVEPELQADVDKLTTQHGDVLHAFVAAQYAATQERLKASGINELTLYRGMKWEADEIPEWAQNVRSTDTLRVPLRPASSFTADGEQAVNFAGRGKEDVPALIIAGTVPAERILATPRTGVGCLGEWEFVVIGGDGEFSAVGNALGDDEDEESLSDHDLTWMAPGTFREDEVLRALGMNPNDQRRRELMARAGDLGMQIKAARTPRTAPTRTSGPTPSDVRNEDWLRTLEWDVRDGRQVPVKDLRTLAAVLGVSEPAAKMWLRTMPAGEAAPKALRAEVKAWTPDESAKHPRAGHGRFAHVAERALRQMVAEGPVETEDERNVIVQEHDAEHNPTGLHRRRRIRPDYSDEQREKLPLTHLYRVVSDADLQRMAEQGHLDTHGGGNMIRSGDDAEGMVASIHPHIVSTYAPHEGPGRLLKIRVEPGDGWVKHYIDGPFYAHTRQPVPFDRLEEVSEPFERDWDSYDSEGLAGYVPGAGDHPHDNLPAVTVKPRKSATTAQVKKVLTEAGFTPMRGRGPEGFHAFQERGDKYVTVGFHRDSDSDRARAVDTLTGAGWHVRQVGMALMVYPGDEQKGRAMYDEAKSAMTEAEHAAWTAEEAAKHPRGVHGRFAHTWMRTASAASQRNPRHVVADVLAHGATDRDAYGLPKGQALAPGTPKLPEDHAARAERLKPLTEYGPDYNREVADNLATYRRMVGQPGREWEAAHWLRQAEISAGVNDEPTKATDKTPITWARHQDGFVSDDGRFYIERRISGSRLYVKADKGDDGAEAIDNGPFAYGRMLAKGDSIAALRQRAEDEPAPAVPSQTGGGSDEPLRGDGGAELAAGRAGGVRSDQGQAGVLPGVGGGSAAAGGRDDGRGTGAGGGRELPRPGEPTERGADDGGRDRVAGATDAAAAARGDAGPGERDSAAGAGVAGGRGDTGGADGLSGRADGVPDESGDDGDLVTGADQPAPDPSQMPGAIGGEDFRPTGIDDLSPAGKIAKLNANMAALRLLRELQRDKRPATPDEQQVLARWAGWGNLAEVFDPRNARFAEARDELHKLMSPAEIREARKNTLNAHYTDARVVEQIWRAVGELGFDGGRVLEPGSGSGTFIGMAPEHAAMVGVELDSTTAAISQFLYPSAVIRNESFGDTNVPEGAFDATVGNVPFGKFELLDPRHNPTGESIHNAFILKSLALTRPGGIVAVLTSRYTLDSQNDRARRLMAERGDLIGAIRLPTGSHERASGTGVIEDILIFRVREPGEPPQEDQSWVTSTKRDINGFKLPVSDYFIEHPENVLGDLTAEKGQYGTGSILVRGDRDMADLPAVIDRLVAGAKADGLTATPRDTTTDLPELIGSDTSRHEGHIRAEDDGTFTQATRGASLPFTVPGKQAPELRGLIGLRDTLSALLTAEAATNEDTPQIAALRDLLNARYDAYVSEFGPINRFSVSKSGARNRPRQGNFRNDPMSAVVRALEKFDPVTQTAEKADVFTKRAVAPRELRTTADNPADALTLSVETYGDVNLPAIAKLLGTDEADARKQLGNLVFEQPPLTDEEQAAAESVATLERLGDIAGADAVDLSSVGESVREAGQLEPAVAYLSGNVRKKLAAARAAAAHDPRFQANVEALERVIPPDLGPEEIDGRLGASWIGPDVIEAFLRDILNERQNTWKPNKKVQVAHSGGSIWTVIAPRQGTLATVQWGTPDRPTPELVQSLLEQREIKVTREVRMPDGTERNVPDLEATLAAQAKAQELQDRFAEWIWENPDRARKLIADYNDRFNAIVLRKYEADPDREWPGMAASWKPYPHVKAAAERIVQEPTVLLAHVVGAGKTSEMTMGAMELRRLGLARKPAIVIPNHMLAQFEREFLEIYPQAKILAAGTEDLAGEKRREFVARAATGDWDAVILTQSAFESIPMSKEQMSAYIDREMAVMRAQLEQAQAADQDNAQKRTVKKMENALERAETALKKKLAKQKDVGVSFEQTGIDYLMVDEAHMYSNLRTLSNIASAGTQGSDRATDLHMKLEYLRANSTSGRIATFATGTPIRNTVTQAYIMQRFLRPDLLEEAGIHTFDQWAATFGEVVSEMELKPEGTGFRQTSRFAKFRNVPEFLRLFHTFADVKMAEDLNLPTPNIVGGRAEVVTVPASDELREYVRSLGDRADAVRAREVDPTEDNMLKISGDGRKAALSMALVGQEHQPGKIEVAADRIAAIHAANKDKTYGDDPLPGALQIVFLDMGTPKDAKPQADAGADADTPARSIDDNDSDFDAYAKLKAELVARGMAPESIRFIHEAKNDAEKAEMFAAAKNGRISVLIGSSEKMGVGTNIQKRAIAMHHLDAPWRPADVEQRDGRIVRQQNMNPDVEVIRYVTEHSFDAYMWQTLERKAKFIQQVMRGSLDVREIEDVGDTALNAAEAKALATGDPDLLEKAKTDDARVKLERLERAHGRAQTNMRAELARYERAIPEWSSTADAYDAAIAQRTDTRGDAFAMTVGGEQYADRKEAAKALIERVDAWQQRVGYYSRDDEPVAEIGGHTVLATIDYDHAGGGKVVKLRFAGVPGDVAVLPVSKLGETTGYGTISRLENTLSGFEGKRDKLREAVQRGQDEIGRIAPRLGQPFPRAAELEAARAKSALLAERMQRRIQREAGADIPWDDAIDGPRRG